MTLPSLRSTLNLILSVLVFGCGFVAPGTLLSRVPCLPIIAPNRLPDELEVITNTSFEGRRP